jgi:SAM-dependent methyltransferase
LPDEQALGMADENSPVFLHGAYDILQSLFQDLPKFETMFRNGRGLGWGEHHACLFTGTARFFRPNYVGNIVANWIPSLTGMTESLKAGTKVADVGCGYGYSTMLMAEAYPKSQFTGFDLHAPSIASAQKMADTAGLTNCRFSVAQATDFGGREYGLITCFDCLRDMADPVGASRHVKQAPRPAHKPARRASARSSAKAASRASGAPPKRHSILCWRPGREARSWVMPSLPGSSISGKRFHHGAGDLPNVPNGRWRQCLFGLREARLQSLLFFTAFGLNALSFELDVR